ncbi:hypothetical protein [Polaromonas sp. CG_9.11]|uniref:hypothetical protein n=1 Tax=Polaromonas sp. CG_9.11 TaxID=2787730 RepID=UPI001A256BDE|nr:hypothetical protein [Polaromonas sp. CG_9.11]
MTHALRDLHVAVPFLINLPSQREIKTAHRLGSVRNGSRFDTAAVATPFAPMRQTETTLQLPDLDLQPYRRTGPTACRSGCKALCCRSNSSSVSSKISHRP